MTNTLPSKYRSEMSDLMKCSITFSDFPWSKILLAEREKNSP